MAVVLGLGNPGARYARTRHNVGVRVLETLVARWRASAREAVPEYRWWQAERAGRAVSLVQPLTYMNASGAALAAFETEHGLDPKLLVVTDDVYLSFGLLRIRARGSSGGHRGLESIEAALGTREYARLRIGVGAASTSAELREHVLEELTEVEEQELQAAVMLAADAVEHWLVEGLLAAMNRFNRKVGKEVPES
ncbi:MAG TPA: aminoacyl-tRNA hydrolase [Candidatus Limnocylindria bacterium]|nr:aminoacyl-tRNA hydrolase [Candidatus Limnocylindria bacterium]